MRILVSRRHATMHDPTRGDPFATKTVTGDVFDPAVDVFMCEPSGNRFRFASGRNLNLAVAVNAHDPARKALPTPDWTEKHKRRTVRAATLPARPAAP